MHCDYTRVHAWPQRAVERIESAEEGPYCPVAHPILCSHYFKPSEWLAVLKGEHWTQL